MKKLILAFLSLPLFAQAQVIWKNVDTAFGNLPSSVHVYQAEQQFDSSRFRGFYLTADLKDKTLEFITDTTRDRRLTPSAFYHRNAQPLAVVNGTFFSFETNRSLNVVITRGKAVAFNTPEVKVKIKDSTRQVRVYRSAIGISKKRKADVAWISADSSAVLKASQQPVGDLAGNYWQARINGAVVSRQIQPVFKKWEMETAIGGGPVLVQNGRVRITNNEEHMFAGKAINDKHPRTAMGYTADGKLVILVVEGRSESSSGVSLTQLANIMQQIGCVEALNLDGGGSSCLLVNGHETIKPSDKEGQRPVPAVFIIRQRK